MNVSILIVCTVTRQETTYSRIHLVYKQEHQTCIIMVMPSSEYLTPGAHSFITSSGATLTYYVTGHGPQLIVHTAPGWGCASVLYQNSFTHLEDDFTFVHLEVRGTRGSSFPEDITQMSSWHMSEDIDALRIHLGLDAIEVLMGHSNGSCIVLWYAIRFAQHVKKLVLVDGQLLGSAAVSRPATKKILDARPERDAVEAFKNYSPSKLTTDEEFGAALGSFLALYLAQPKRDLEKFKAAFTNTPQVKCTKSQGAAESQHANQVDHLANVTANTLIIVGKEDFICPVPVSEMMAAGIKKSRLEVVEDSGHLPWIEQAEKFAEILKSFCSK